MIKIWFIVGFQFLVLGVVCQNTNSDWAFYEETDGIKVYHKTLPQNGLKELKLIARTSAPIPTIIEGITNIDSFETWAFNCIKAEVVKRITRYDFYYHFVSDSPWPLDDRDLVIHMKLTRDTLSGNVIINTQNTEGILPVDPNLVRVKFMRGQWVLRPFSSDSTEIEYSIVMDPGGNIPVWLMNYAMDYSSVNTMNSLKQRVENP